MSKQPNTQFLLAHPAHFIALGFGSGLTPKAPGTFGTIIGLPLYYLISPYSMTLQLCIITISFLIGIYLCALTGKALGDSDHGSIVWDEIVAMMLVLTITPKAWPWWLLAFGLFRLFDIWKPFPIRQCDAKLKGGFGVMLDDLLAAFYAMFIMWGLLWMT
ncbi:MAG: phosphatidylglycerophosphatase A [Methylophilaceae bacterium]|nr:phosphatidylglycerophosphatase A [Methylophilaceae bacterium]